MRDRTKLTWNMLIVEVVMIILEIIVMRPIAKTETTIQSTPSAFLISNLPAGR